MATTYNLLFVCTGNTCRSPMAEALARAEIERRGWKHVEVRSAGTMTDPGHPAADHAVAVLGRRGIDLSVHRSSPLDERLVGWADLILTMSESHLDVVRRLGGETRASMIGDFVAGGEGLGARIPDPFGRDEAQYERTADVLSRLVNESLDRIAPIVQP